MPEDTQPQKPVRLFIGSPLEGPAFDTLSAYCTAKRHLIEGQSNLRFSWVPPENWHMTWLFLGSVPAKQVSEIELALDEVTTGNRRLMLQLEKLAFWPNQRKARLLVWEGALHMHLERLASRIVRTLPQYREDKPFFPHITVARLKPPNNGGKPYLKVPPEWLILPETWHIQSLNLYKSTLTPQGAVYQSLKAWPLP